MARTRSPPEIRHRSAAFVAALLTYATALYGAYVATFIYFVHLPFRPNGPYGQWYCHQPHLLLGQICRDFSEKATTSWSRVGLCAAFLVVFLLLALVARRFLWWFFLFPLATIPFFPAEHRVWVVSSIVMVLSITVIAGFETLARVPGPRRFSWLPLSLLTSGTALATVVSILTSTWVPPLVAVRNVDGLTTSVSTELHGIACPATATCVAVGEHDSATSSIAIWQQLHDGVWTRPTPIGHVYSLSDIACAGVGECLALEPQSEDLLALHDGTWHADGGGVLPTGPNDFDILSPGVACSPGGLCWATYQADVGNATGSGYETSYAVGEDDGHWLAPHRVGPSLSAGEIAHDGRDQVSAISCWSTTFCTVVGAVLTSGPNASDFRLRPFVQSEVRGIWGASQFVPPSLGRDHERFWVSPLSAPLTCTAQGTCLLGGYEAQGEQIFGAAVEQEVRGRWLAASVVSRNVAGSSVGQVQAVACHSIALCVEAGGGSGRPVFRAEVHGRWGQARIVPGGAGFLDFVRPTAAACPTASTCFVTGWMTTASNQRSAFVASYDGGRWSYRTFGLGLGEVSTEIEDLVCTSSSCWSVGTAQWADRQEEGFADLLVGPR